MPALDADPRYGRFGLRTDCPRCGAHLPINGLVDEVGCAACGHHVSIPEDVLIDLLKRFDDEFPEPGTGGTVVEKDLTFRWTAEAIDAPACVACSASLPPEAFADARPDGGSPACCPSCGAEQPLSSPLKTVRHRVKTATLVIGGETDLTRREARRDPVALQCPNCGAGLTIGQDRERLTPCDYCGTQVHLPDAVWRALHPPREVEEWVVQFTGPSPGAVRKREADEKIARQVEKRRKKQERRRRKEELDRQQAKRRREQKEAERQKQVRKARFRTRTGIAAQIVTMVLTLAASGLALLSILAYASPATFAALGVSSAVSFLLGPTLLGVSTVLLLGCWLLAVVAAIWRANIKAVPSFFQSLFHLATCFIPLIGAFGALGLAIWYASGAMPRPPGKQYANYKGPRGNGWPIALVLAVLGPFVTVVAAVLFDVTIWEMLVRMGDD